MRTPKNILMHELIGLGCEVVAASNTSQIGVKGRIEDETMKNIVLEGKTIPKKGSVFRISLGKLRVDVKGDMLVARPEDRIKKKFRKW
jgi:ribonuclease P protein subunit POP4